MTYSKYTIMKLSGIECHIHDLYQVYTEMSGIEMSYMWPVSGMAGITGGCLTYTYYM